MLSYQEYFREVKKQNMEILNKKISLTMIFAFVAIAIIVGSCTALAVVSPIWSNVTPYTATVQSWTGTVALTLPSATGTTGQPITLKATLNPLPTQYQSQQIVTFYFSNLSTTSSTTQITNNPVTGLALVGGGLNTNPTDVATSSATTENGIATLTMKPQISGTFYFIAEIATPT